MTDILDFDSLDTTAANDKGFELELLNPATKKPLGVFLSIIGTESAEVKAEMRREINRERVKDFQAARKGGAAEPKTIEEQEADTIRLAARLCKGWRTVKDGKSEKVIYWKGEKLDFNPDNLNHWLSTFGWARLQIIEAAGDLGNFLGN